MSPTKQFPKGLNRMANRNLDSSALTTQLKNRIPANYYNRYQVVQESETLPNISPQLSVNPQTANTDASNTVTINSGIPTVYWKNYPILTSNAPCVYVTK